MITIDLQNKGDRLDSLQGDYTVVSAVYDESNLFVKFIHILMEKITSGSFKIKNKYFEVDIIFDKTDDPKDTIFTFDVYFLRFNQTNPLIVVITNEVLSKYFTYTEFASFFAIGSIKLSDIKDYSKDNSILEELYSESFKINKRIIYRLEKKESYQGVDVKRNDSAIVSESYTHQPKEYFDQYKAYVSFENSKLSLFFDESIDSGPIEDIQDLVYSSITVDYIWDGEVLERINLSYVGNFYTYNRDRAGRLKYYGSSSLGYEHKIDYKEIEQMERQEMDSQQTDPKDGQEDQNRPSEEEPLDRENDFVKPVTPSLEDYYRRFGTPAMDNFQNGEHQTEDEKTVDIEKREEHTEPRPHKNSRTKKSFTRRFTSNLIGNSYKFTDLLPDHDVNTEDYTSSSGLQGKSIYETYTKAGTISNDPHRDFAEWATGFGIGVLITIPLFAYPAYVGYRRYIRQ